MAFDGTAPAAAGPLLAVRGLTKRYGARTGCADVTFDLFAGEVLGIVGESGWAKSMLLSCLAGQIFADLGHVLHDRSDAVVMAAIERPLDRVRRTSGSGAICITPHRGS